jgi:hypothetical protein
VLRGRQLRVVGSGQFGLVGDHDGLPVRGDDPHPLRQVDRHAGLEAVGHVALEQGGLVEDVGLAGVVQRGVEVVGKLLETWHDHEPQRRREGEHDDGTTHQKNGRSTHDSPSRIRLARG